MAYWKNVAKDLIFFAIKGKIDEDPYLEVQKLGEKDTAEFIEWKIIWFWIKEFTEGKHWAFKQCNLFMQDGEEKYMLNFVLSNAMWRCLANSLCSLEDFDKALYVSPYKNKKGQNTLYTTYWDEKLWRSFDSDWLKKEFFDEKTNKYDLDALDILLEKTLLEKFASLIREDNFSKPIVEEEWKTPAEIIDEVLEKTK